MLAKNILFEKNYYTKIKLSIPFGCMLPIKFLRWNQKWGAPFDCMFAYQGNNVTRYYEYPWAFHAIKLKRGMRVLDFGGGLCGFQFVLSKCGLVTHNVDPGLESKGIGWSVNERSIRRLNKKFGTSVKLYNNFIEKANLPSNYYDVIYSISVFEHLTKNELLEAMKHIKRVLKPGGYLVMTVDLFPNVYPFTKKKTNRWGRNVSIKKLIETSGLKIIKGDKKELYGFREFNKDNILENLQKYFIGSNYPTLIQTIILKK